MKTYKPPPRDIVLRDPNSDEVSKVQHAISLAKHDVRWTERSVEETVTDYGNAVRDRVFAILGECWLSPEGTACVVVPMEPDGQGYHVRYEIQF